MLTTFHNSLIRNEYATIQSGYKECQELISCPLASFELKDVVEVRYHRVEQFIDQLESQIRFEMFQELIPIYKLLVVVEE